MGCGRLPCRAAVVAGNVTQAVATPIASHCERRESAADSEQEWGGETDVRCAGCIATRRGPRRAQRPPSRYRSVVLPRKPPAHRGVPWWQTRSPSTWRRHGRACPGHRAPSATCRDRGRWMRCPRLAADSGAWRAAGGRGARLPGTCRSSASFSRFLHFVGPVAVGVHGRISRSERSHLKTGDCEVDWTPRDGCLSVPQRTNGSRGANRSRRCFSDVGGERRQSEGGFSCHRHPLRGRDRGQQVLGSSPSADSRPSVYSSPPSGAGGGRNTSPKADRDGYRPGERE